MPTLPEEWAVLIVVLGLFAGLLVLGALVLRDTIRKDGRWGINFKSLAGAECPNCDAPLPAVRKPKNFQQVLWGGWTCPECGCQIDKWGREVPGTRPDEDDR
ncbi:MAG TPA: hypothetical protein VKE74_18580 [Gemmataceae bacterium]|nr:hypothetical protein [Gemmataceae bacterium]